MAKEFFSKSLFLSCLATTAIASFVPASPAYASDPDLSFHPAGKWQISKSAQGCNASAEFNNGYIIAFDGRADSFNHLSIDFRQDTFESGKTYNVKFSIPGGESQKINATASNATSLGAGLSNQKTLTSGLIKTGVLDVDVEGNAFRFYMTGLGAALKTSRDCNTEIAKKSPSNELALTEKTNQKPPLVLKTDNNDAGFLPLPDDLKAETASIKPVAQNNQTKPNSGEREVFTSEDPVDSSATTSLQEKMALMAAKDSGLPMESKQKNDKQTPPPAVDSKLAPLKPAEDKTATPMPKAIADAKPVTSNKQDSKVKPVDLTQKPDVTPPTAKQKIEKENIKAASVSEKIKSPAPKITHAPKIKMEADFTKAEDINPASGSLPPLKEVADIKPNQIQPIDNESRKKIKALESELFRLQKEKDNLDQDLKSALQDAREERLSVSSENWDLERATMKFNESERQIERLGRQLQTQKTQCEMEKRDLEGMLFDPKVTDQQQLAKLAALEAELEQSKADLLMQKRSFEERIRILEEQLEK